MKQVLCILSIILSLFLFLTCSMQPSASPEAEWEAVKKEAACKTGRAMELSAAASESGDYSGLLGFLAAEDPEGELTSMVLPKTLASRSLTVPPPWTDPPEESDFQGGDVLVFAGTGESIQSMIMSLVLLDANFGHAGIVDGARLDPTDEEDDFILSAMLDYGESGFINGLTFQSLQDLIDGSAIILRLRYNPKYIPKAVAATEIFVEDIFPNPTMYAFIDWLFRPISRDDLYRWYCSKVPWYIYNMFGYDIENNDFYELDDPEGIWTKQRDSLGYKLYKKFLKILTPDWLERWLNRKNPDWLQDAADERLKWILEEVITPDELWAFRDPYIEIEAWAREGVKIPGIKIPTL